MLVKRFLIKKPFLSRFFTYCVLNTREILSVKGNDTIKYLQGLISNDINKLVKDNNYIIYSGIFDSRGRVESDIFIHKLQNIKNSEIQLFIDCCSKYSQTLIKLLNLYKLRSKVEISNVSNQYKLINVFNNEDLKETQKVEFNNEFNHEFELELDNYADPRCLSLGCNNSLGYRLIVNKNSKLLQNNNSINEINYKISRYKLGICENSNEISPKVAIPLEYNFDLLNASF